MEGSGAPSPASPPRASVSSMGIEIAREFDAVGFPAGLADPERADAATRGPGRRERPADDLRPEVLQRDRPDSEAFG
eukprot:6971397-Pyramimonas_sp.AAC.1